MMKTRRVLTVAGGLLVVGLLMGVGCATLRTPAWQYSVHVTISEALADSSGNLPSVEVHLLALDTVRGMSFQRLPMGKYWNPARRPSEYLTYVMRFGRDAPTRQTLDISDPVWRHWSSPVAATYLFILADLPGIYEDKDDVADPRRCILPLDPARWQGQRNIQIMIEPNGVFCLTPRTARSR